MRGFEEAIRRDMEMEKQMLKLIRREIKKLPEGRLKQGASGRGVYENRTHSLPPDGKRALAIARRNLLEVKKRTIEENLKMQERLEKKYKSYRDDKVLEQVFELAAVARSLAKKNFETPVRVQVLAWRLLERHAEFCEGLADVLIYKCRGYDKLALEKMDAFIASFGRHDYELERWCDFGLFSRLTRSIVIKMPSILI